MKKCSVNRLKVHGTILLTLLALIVFWGCFYLLLGWLLFLLHISIPPLFLHIASSLLGFLVFGFVMVQYGKYLRPKRLDYFQTIIQAIRQMAKGNFEIKLDIPISEGATHQKNPFVQLTDSIHYMAKELGQLERVRQEFISNVSHEIQSPLTSIKGFAHALEDGRLSQEKRIHYLKIIQLETDRLSGLSNHLLKLTSLENGRHPVRIEHYRADRQIRSCLLTLEPQWSAKKLKMNINLAPVAIHADRELMNQVWMNMIHNSIKFTPEKGTISITLKLQNDCVLFRISDTGIGLKEEERIHLFERFYKADRSRTGKHAGNGLGLSIVNKIIDLHHGTIRVDSEYGKGTSFSVFLEK
ncbi:HAMP domain-containing histidine kinase [Sporolactobacillus sp. CPB3-1]|uniref:histidine kinase n=1 Tax=Sporolactobacillus mangiferae TaxID=2940498 RepID=A0ABT0MAL0_9BACL|nr:HAMP domain-containing sensor histidine kinase [Sporolactobacillus mangiferae]MCL1631897.1 HAMP domain-containing histidine kinase [Sporolactobacillus mangiferae]